MRGLRSKLQRRLRLLLACLVLSLAVAPPLVGLSITPAVAALASPSQGPQSSTASPHAASRSAREADAPRLVSLRGHKRAAALVVERTLFGASRGAAFDGRRLYLRHLALLC